jgi:hypothetical protein
LSHSRPVLAEPTCLGRMTRHSELDARRHLAEKRPYHGCARAGSEGLPITTNNEGPKVLSVPPGKRSAGNGEVRATVIGPC